MTTFCFGVHIVNQSMVAVNVSLLEEKKRKAFSYSGLVLRSETPWRMRVPSSLCCCIQNFQQWVAGASIILSIKLLTAQGRQENYPIMQSMYIFLLDFLFFLYSTYCILYQMQNYIQVETLKLLATLSGLELRQLHGQSLWIRDLNSSWRLYPNQEAGQMLVTQISD